MVSYFLTWLWQKKPLFILRPSVRCREVGLAVEPLISEHIQTAGKEVLEEVLYCFPCHSSKSKLKRLGRIVCRELLIPLVD